MNYALYQNSAFLLLLKSTTNTRSRILPHRRKQVSYLKGEGVKHTELSRGRIEKQLTKLLIFNFFYCLLLRSD